MVRSLKLISKKKERQKAFLRGKGVLMKKAFELSVLCDVKVGMMIYCPEDVDDHLIRNSEPLIWPENPQEIHSLIESYKKNQGESSGRNFDSSKVLNHQIRKAKKDLAQLKHKNAESKRPGWDDQLNSLSSQELVQFSCVLENKITEIRFRVDAIKEYLTYFSKQSSSVTAAMVDASNDPLFLENRNMFESKSNVWQPMNPPPPQYGYVTTMDASKDPLFLETESKNNVWKLLNPPDQYGVEVPLYNTFDADLAVVPIEEMQHSTPEMSYYCAPVADRGYGQDIQALTMSYCAPMMSDYALAIRQWQPQMASYVAETEKLWWQF